MATIQAAGIRLDLVGPSPVAPPYSLLKTEGVLVQDDTRWLNGVNVIGFPADVPFLWDACSDGSDSTKDAGGDRPQATFDAFTVYLPLTCSTFGYADLAEQAQAVLEATQSMGVEEALAQGIPGSGNPYFGDANLTILGGAAVSAAVALAYLEDAIGQTGRGGIIHATPAVISRLQPLLWPQETGLYTINGTPVVSGDGYIGSDPDSGSSPGDGQDWIFATGPVQVRLGPAFITDLVQSLDRSDNTVTFRAERNVLALWDTALQAGVLVDWNP